MNDFRITDPALVLTPGLLDALEQRYAGATEPIVLRWDDYAARYAAVCDAVVQVLWPGQYRTGPGDPGWHDSDPARMIAHIVLTAAGIMCEPDPRNAEQPPPGCGPGPEADGDSDGISEFGYQDPWESRPLFGRSRVYDNDPQFPS